jgi:hypothetical protein
MSHSDEYPHGMACALVFSLAEAYRSGRRMAWVIK